MKWIFNILITRSAGKSLFLPEQRPTVWSTVSSCFRFFLLFPLLLYGCIFDDLSDCPVEDTTLKIRLEFPETFPGSVFTDNIGSVDLILYNEDTLFYQHLRLDKNLLQQTDILLPVTPGEYFIVGWSNLSDKTGFDKKTATDHFNETYYYHTEEVTGGKHIWYAPRKNSRSADFKQYSVVAEEKKETLHMLSFMPASHVVYIYIKGLPDVTLAEAYLENVPGGYDFHLIPLGKETVAHNQECIPVEIEGEKMFRASFYIPHLNDENTIIAGIRVTEKEFCEEIRLEEYIRNHDLDITDGGACEIPLLFEYDGDVLVQVTLPGWVNHSTEGGF